MLKMKNGIVEVRRKAESDLPAYVLASGLPVLHCLQKKKAKHNAAQPLFENSGHRRPDDRKITKLQYFAKTLMHAGQFPLASSENRCVNC